jgi:hypothetical protein
LGRFQQGKGACEDLAASVEVVFGLSKGVFDLFALNADGVDLDAQLVLGPACSAARSRK